MSVSLDMELSLDHRLNTRAHTGHLPVMRLSWTHRWQPSGHTAAPARALPFAAHAVRAELDAIAAVIRGGEVEAAVGRLRTFLHDCSRRMWPSGWQVLARTVVREHPLIDVIHESPFARQIFGRGSAAGLSYALEDVAAVPAGTTERGRRIAASELAGSTPRAMRAGRDLIARAIDGLAVERAGARILPIDTCAALESSVYDLLTGIDLITVHGSYEHLSDAGAAASTAQLFGRLAPGGRLLIAHVGPDGSDRAYLEACMNWWMTCRDENALDRLMAAIPDDEGIRSARAYRDPSGGVVVFEVVRGQASGAASAPRRQQ